MAGHNSDLEYIDVKELRLLARAIKPCELTFSQVQRMKQAIIQNIRLDQSTSNYTVPAAEDTWQTLLCGIEIKMLAYDKKRGTQTALWRCSPGAKLSRHTHKVDEECYILEGDISHQCLRSG